MAKGNTTATAPGLSFPREIFAKITPKPFLHAHLKQSEPVRANGRAPAEIRRQTINTGSLTHSNGSAVVRSGDTAIVCGVRAEILLASDIPQPTEDGMDESSLPEELGLLVPNVELSTGCSPAHLPGNPPGTLAQSLSHRVLTLLCGSGVVDPSALRILHTEPVTDDNVSDDKPRIVTKAYWTLYIDILCIALDGNAFDTIWTAVVASLRNTLLPQASWDPDRQMIVCSPRINTATNLRLNLAPMASTFAVFSTASPEKDRAQAQSWVIADPDGFEEDVCDELLTVVCTFEQEKFTVVRLEKEGGSVIGSDLLAECFDVAKQTFAAWQRGLKCS